MTPRKPKADAAAGTAVQPAARRGITSQPLPPVVTNNDAQAALLERYPWAVNAIKLNRAIATVRAEQKGLSGKEFEAAAKEQYVKYGGLLADDETPSAPRKTKIVNLADEDPNSQAADDTDEDE